jgi:hypothetical protein
MPLVGRNAPKRQENSMKKTLFRAIAAFTLSSFTATASAATCFVFLADIQATASGPYTTFQNTVRQPIIVRGAGAVTHPFELLIVYPGDANGFGVQPGAIELMTNSMFARNEGMRLAQFDLGSLQPNEDGSFTFTLDPAAALQLPPPNVLAVQGISGSPQGIGGICLLPGLAALCNQTQQAPVLQLYYLVPAEGVLRFGFPGGNTIVGEMNVNGYGIDNPDLRGNYSAVFSGPCSHSRSANSRTACASYTQRPA